MRRVLAISLAMLVLAGVAIFLEPTRVVIGWVHRESFYDSRPASFWEAQLRDRTPSVRTHAIKTLSDGRAAAVPVLVELLQKETGYAGQAAEMRWTAASILYQMGPAAREARPALIEALHDVDPVVRVMAIKALGKLGREAAPALPALVPLLATAERLSVLKVLQEINQVPSEAVPLLRENLGDGEAEVRGCAAAVLALKGPEAAVAVADLVDLLEDDDSDVRRQAVEALGAIGPAAKEALPALGKLRNEADPEVRRRAQQAIRSIAPAVPK
jgi:HEAT repeat protein